MCPDLYVRCCLQQAIRGKTKNRRRRYALAGYTGINDRTKLRHENLPVTTLGSRGPLDAMFYNAGNSHDNATNPRNPLDSLAHLKQYAICDTQSRSPSNGPVFRNDNVRQVMDRNRVWRLQVRSKATGWVHAGNLPCTLRNLEHRSRNGSTGVYIHGTREGELLLQSECPAIRLSCWAFCTGRSIKRRQARQASSWWVA